MKTLFILLLLCVTAVCACADPLLDDDFSAYGPGSTGAPSWSALAGTTWHARDGQLRGPVVSRWNKRPPIGYSIRIEATFPEEEVNVEFGLYLNATSDTDLDSADVVMVSVSADRSASLVTGADGPTTLGRRSPVSLGMVSDNRATLRVLVSGDDNAVAVQWNGKTIGKPWSPEYPGGPVSVMAGARVGVDRVLIEPLTDEDKALLRKPGLLTGIRDVAVAQDGSILALMADATCVWTLNAKGDITGGFGRRLAGHLPDAVALSVGKDGMVYVLNRKPAEVVVYQTNGGINKRFGLGQLKEPSDVAVLSDGRVLVADPGARGLSIFDAAGNWVRTITKMEDRPFSPLRVAEGSTGEIYAGNDSERVEFRLTGLGLPDFISRTPVAFRDTTVMRGKTVFAQSDAVLMRGDDTRRFRADACGGLGRDARLIVVGETLYILLRESGLLVEVPASLSDVVPTITRDATDSSAVVVKWTTPEPSVRSRVQVLRGGQWENFVSRIDVPSREHAVALKDIIPENGLRFRFSPCLRSIPESEWSREYEIGEGGAR
jgi:hypothetical protein